MNPNPFETLHLQGPLRKQSSLSVKPAHSCLCCCVPPSGFKAPPPLIAQDFLFSLAFPMRLTFTWKDTPFISITSQSDGNGSIICTIFGYSTLLNCFQHFLLNVFFCRLRNALGHYSGSIKKKGGWFLGNLACSSISSSFKSIVINILLYLLFLK